MCPKDLMDMGIRIEINDDTCEIIYIAINVRFIPIEKGAYAPTWLDLNIERDCFMEISMMFLLARKFQ